jgi:apolipoprotein N-acyltransferase
MPWRWMLAYVAATFFAFPQPIRGDFVLDLGLVLAPAAPALLLVALRGLAPGRALSVGFVAGWLANAALLHWGYVVTVTYGHAPVAVGLLAPFGMALYPAAFVACFAFIVALLARRRLANPLLLAAVWTTGEWLRSWVLTGFTWGGLGYAWHANVLHLALTAITGVYGLSFLAVVLGASALRVVEERRGGASAWRELVLAAAVLAVTAALAAWQTVADRPIYERQPRVRVAALQGNIDQNQKWSEQAFEETLLAYEELTRRAAADGAQLIVWPETAVPAPLAIPDLHDRIAALAREVRTPLIVGAVGMDFDAQGRRTAHYDSAFVFSAEGELLDRYDKTHLVPFGEYLPLRPLLGRFVRAIATGSIQNDVSEGERVRAIDVPLTGWPDRVRVGIPICYELIFPDLVRRFAEDGAELLVGITNDAWYGRTGSPYQFLAMTALRSAETRVAGVRSANTGVSALVGSNGRARATTAIFERDLVVGELPILERDRPSFYARHGDLFAHACTVATVLGCFFAFLRGRNQP